MLRSLQSRMIAWAAILAIFDTVVIGGAINIAHTHSFTSQQYLAMAAGAALTIIISIATAYTLATRALQPFRDLRAATKALTQGRFPQVELQSLESDTDIGPLAHDIAEMAVRLKEIDSRDRRFLMSISHELRTPLTAINGHAQALEDGLAEDPETRARSLAVIRREAARLDRLVEDIIDLAKLRSNRFTTVTELVWLQELGEHVMAIFADQGDKVEIRGDFENIDFHSDGSRILQILRILINNALRYAQTGINVTGERVRNRIRITVSNDGEPIPDELHEQIFEPFVGQKREGGMGLGLAIGRELAWALGGNLRTVPSATGALFELTLPFEPPGSGR